MPARPTSPSIRPPARQVWSRQVPVESPEPGARTGEVYRRDARRLRLRYQNQAGALHASLHNLARRQDAKEIAAPSGCAPRVQTKVAPTHDRPGDSIFARAVVDWFADHIAAHLNDRLLHHTDRQALLKTAERLGIGRFHANLMIAVCQHHAGESRSTGAPEPEPGRPRFPRVVLFSVLLVQAVIVWLGWHAFHA